MRKYSSAGKRQVLAAGLGIAASKVDGNLTGIAVGGNKLYLTAGNKVFAADATPSALFSNPKEFRNVAAGLASCLYLVGGESLYKYFPGLDQFSEVCKMGANTYGLVVRKTGSDNDDDIFFNSAASVWHVRDSHRGPISSPNRVIDWLGPAEGALAGDNNGGFYTSAKPRGEKYWGIHTGERQEKVTSG